ncbi:putative ribonuclease H-like domain-containing protein [Tanacetum coccineum]
MNGSSVDERGKTHHGKSNLFQETPKPLCSTFLPTDVKHCLNVGYTFVNFTTSEAVWKSHVCITRKSWPLFKSKKIAQVVRAWIQSKNSLVKHFEDMRLCRPSKEYLQVWFDPPRDESMSCLTTKGMHTIGAVCASTPIETQKPLVKDEEASDVDVHLYRSMIGSLMYVTASRPDIMFAVCACSRFQVTPKTSHLSAVKRIFRYLKGKPKLGLWYPRESSFDLESYSDSDYAGANLDRKSTTGGCQFLGRRLITWQCKKQTIVATSTTEAEYVAAASCCGQVLWIQNQMLDYGFNFMNTKIYIDNESTICIVKNPVYHSKTKHIAIRHHFIRDAYEKKLIQFWTSAKSKTINNVRHITAKVASKVVSISEASIRTDLNFNDADGIDTLPNQAIFDAIQLMGYEGDLTVLTFNKALFSPQWRHLEAKKKFVMYPRFISIFLARQLVNITVPLDHFPVNSLTSKVFSFMIKKGKHFSGKITPLFDNMLVQPTQEEGASSERLSEEQPSPSPAPTSEVPNKSLPDSSSAQASEVPFEQQPDPSPSPSPRPSPNPSPTPIVPDSIPEHTGENLGDHSSNDQSLLGNEDAMTLQNVYDLCISLDKGKKKIEREDETESEDDDIPTSSKDWKIISGRLHKFLRGTHFNDIEGVVIHMLTENEVSFKKEILMNVKFKIRVMEKKVQLALELIRFIKKVLADLESKEQD